MFTGIVEGIGKVAWLDGDESGRRLRIEAGDLAEGLAVGASVSVNGTCLTAVSVDPPAFEVEVIVETLMRTNLGAVGVGDRVNLERALPATGRLEGHIVQGHVDGVGEVESVEPEGNGRRLTVSAPDAMLGQLVEKGSVAVDGVSLTVAGLGDGSFEVALIPHTLKHTTLGEREPGDTVNLEADILAKYVERLLRRR